MTRSRLIVLTVIVWLAAVWVLFLMHQTQLLVKENHALGYILSLVKVLGVLIGAAGIGLRILRPGSVRPADILAASALGLCILGILTFILGALGLMRPYLIWISVGILIGFTYKDLISAFSAAGRVFRAGAADKLHIAFLCMIVFAALVGLVNCLAPLTANDALVYHLNLPKIYASEGSLVRLPYNVYANMPHYGEILYTLFYSVSGEAGAKISYFLILLGAAGSVYALARRFVGARAATIGASFFLVQPLVIDHRVICNVDIMLAYLYMSAAIIAFRMVQKRGEIKYSIALGLLAGFILGIKYTALIPCLSLSAIPFMMSARKPDLKRIAIAVLIALVVFMPWVIRHEVTVGNPLYPLFEGRFDGDNWDQVQSRQLVAWQRSMGMGRDMAGYLLLPFRISTQGKPGMNYTRFDGTISPILLILLPFAFFKRKRATTVLLVMGLACFVFWALTSQQLRFLIPALALASVLAAIAVANLAKWLGARSVEAVLVFLLLIEISLFIVPDQYGSPVVSNSLGERLAAVCGLEPRTRHLERNIQSFEMFTHVNRTTPRDEPIFLVWENRAYYLDRPYFADSFFEASTLMRMAAGRDSRGLRDTIVGMGCRHVVVNDLLGNIFSGGYDPQTVAALEDFIATYLKPLHSSNRLTLYTIITD